MRNASYIGELPHLLGKRALLRNGEVQGRVLAQFDDRTTTLSGRDIESFTVKVLEHEPHARFHTERAKLFRHPPADALGFGWHEFPEADFCFEEGTE